MTRKDKRGKEENNQRMTKRINDRNERAKRKNCNCTLSLKHSKPLQYTIE